MNKIDDKESLNEKYNVRTLIDIKKLQESLNEANTGNSYKGYIICYGCHETDRWYVKDGWDQFVGNKSGYTSEEEAREYVDSIID